MKQQPSSANRALTYTVLPEMGVVKEFNYDTDNSIYQQIRRALPGGIPLVKSRTLFINLPLDNPANRYLKRAIDIILSLVVILCILSWFIPVMALIIKLDSRGPVFFLQRRNKRSGGVFTCFKFRSMIVNAESDVMPASKNDQRITRVGKFIRSNFIDELPQFLNVLIGDMSVIGPRPHMLSDNLKYEQEVEFYNYRHNVKPGITGLAQVMGYVGETDSLNKMKDRVLLDNFYLRNWTLRLDLVILIRTFLKTTGH